MLYRVEARIRDSLGAIQRLLSGLYDFILDLTRKIIQQRNKDLSWRKSLTRPALCPRRTTKTLPHVTSITMLTPITLASLQ
jgi:hypothetical protein